MTADVPCSIIDGECCAGACAAGKEVGTDVLQGTWTPTAPQEPFQIAFFWEPD